MRWLYLLSVLSVLFLYGCESISNTTLDIISNPTNKACSAYDGTSDGSGGIRSNCVAYPGVTACKCEISTGESVYKCDNFGSKAVIYKKVNNVWADIANCGDNTKCRYDGWESLFNSNKEAVTYFCSDVDIDPWNKCTDSDGLTLTTKGKVFDGLFSYEDRCLTSSLLQEYYCKDNKLTTLDWSCVCDGGKCITGYTETGTKVIEMMNKCTPITSDWSSCKDGKESRTIMYADCTAKVETQNCTSQPIDWTFVFLPLILIIIGALLIFFGSGMFVLIGFFSIILGLIWFLGVVL